MMPPPLLTLLRAFAVWVLMMAAESLQGALRRVAFGDDVVVRRGGVILGVAVVFAIAWATLRWLRPGGARQALGVGVLWAALTFAFEIGLGRLMGLGWSPLLADYDPARGGLMPFGLFAMALAPWIIWTLRKPARA